MSRRTKESQIDFPAIPCRLELEGPTPRDTKRLVAKVKAILARRQTVTIAVESTERRDALAALFTPTELGRIGFMLPGAPRDAWRNDASGR